MKDDAMSVSGAVPFSTHATIAARTLCRASFTVGAFESPAAPNDVAPFPPCDEHL